ncbi:MAG: mechanosensitive ion channel family protein [Candidatus Saccharibacteria bacterium]
MASWLDVEIVTGITVAMLILFTLVLILGIALGKLVSILIRRYLDEKVGRRLSKTIARLAFYTIIIAAVIIGFGQALQQQLSGLIISLGLVGVAVAFASQQIIQNILSGILISVTRPIQLEDWVEVGGTPTTGVARVKDITLMNTILRDVEGRIAIVPNSQIINSKLINYTQSGFVAVTVPMWIGPDSDMELIRKIVYEEADIHPRILPTVTGEEKKIVLNLLERPAIRRLFGANQNLSVLNPKVNIVDLQGTRVKIEIRVWLREINNRDEIISEFLDMVKKRFAASGVKVSDS